jgi:HPr kinase/phosphorylase
MIEVAEVIRDTAKRLGLVMIAGDSGVHRTVGQMELNRPGLALAGFFELFQASRIQIIGNTEILYLSRMSALEREGCLRPLFAQPLPCVIVTNRNTVPEEMIQLAEEFSVPLYGAKLNTTELSLHLSHYLIDRFASSETIHGTLVDVYGNGLLFVGPPGIGKSEIALDLVERGHRLVADDVVVLTLKAPGILIGSGPEMLKHMLEIRGIGVIDVRQMFGVRAIRLQKRVETVVELHQWDNREEYERLGLKYASREYLGINIPLIRLPIYPGKNVTVIAEAIALRQHLQVYGHNAAQELVRRQSSLMRHKRKISDYLRWDKE